MKNATEIYFDNYSYLTTGGDRYFRGCTRCGGTGHYSFNGFDSICYKCNNDPDAKLGVYVGSHDDAAKDAATRLKGRLARDAKKEAKRMVFIHQMEAKQAAVKAEDPGVFSLIEAAGEDDNAGSFMRSMYENLFFATNSGMKFTDKMITAVRKVLRAKEEREANLVPVPVTEARMTFTGEIISTKIVENDYGTALKIVLQDDRGFRVYGSLASSLRELFVDEFDTINGHDHSAIGYGVWFTGSTTEPETFKGIKGRHISFQAKVAVSDDDKGFGFFTRPTKAALLTA